TKRNDNAFGPLIGWFIRIGQSERRTRSRFDYFKRLPISKLYKYLLLTARLPRNVQRVRSLQLFVCPQIVFFGSGCHVYVNVNVCVCKRTHDTLHRRKS
ncbi:hypothetical protein SFRURICE_020005, partial [Spodoptera frugiperda]